MTYLEKNSNDYNNMKKNEKFLNLTFDIEKLEIVSNYLYKGIMGPVGNLIISL